MRRPLPLLLPAILAATAPATAPLNAQVTTIQKKVVIAGQNPGIRLLDKQGGTEVTDALMWRAHWSPAGAGTVCYLTTREPGGKVTLRIALYDNEKVLEHVNRELMAGLLGQTPDPFTPVKATITSSDAPGEHRENCKSDQYNVELIWRGIQEGHPYHMTSPTGLEGTFVIALTDTAEVRINGKSAGGSIFPGRGQGMGLPQSYLAFNETWLR